MRRYDDDRKLARAIVKGDRDSLRTLFDAQYAPVYRYCLRYVSESDAEEIATDTLRQAIRRLETYRGEASLTTWIGSVARSQLSMHLKKINRRPRMYSIDQDEQIRQKVEGMANELETLEQSQETADRQALVHRLLDALPRDYGDILEWKYIEGLSVEEIAARLNTTSTSIQSKLARARNAFRTHFEETGLDPNFTERALS